jgi:hypothetical protein
LIISVFVGAALALIVGCGGGDGGNGGSGSVSAEAAGFAAPGSLVYLEANLRPTGELKSNVDAAAKKVVGNDDFSQFIVSKLEASAGDEGKPVDFAKEVEPWLGKTAGVSFARMQGEGELSEPVIAIQTTEPKETQRFIEKRTSQGSKPYKAGTYKGFKFEVGGSEGNAIGLVGNWALLADGEKEFKAAVDAYEGDSLADEARFADAFAEATKGSLADIYIDVGGIVEKSEGEVDPQLQAALEGAGVDTGEATAVASVIPSADQIQIDLSGDLGEQPPEGNGSKLLGSLPADSNGAVALAGFTEQFEEAVDNLDENGSPPDLEPGELKSTLNKAGVDIDKIAASLEEAALFVEGSDQQSAGGALVVTAKNEEAAEAVTGLGTLLRGAGVPGITAVTGKASGFSIHSFEPAGKAIVVVGKGNRIAIGYGLPAALSGLNAGSGPTLSGTAGYKEAVASLGKTPISAYVDGPSALRLAEALVPHSKTDFWEAVPYLKKITFIAAGSGANGELATAKLIAGLPK